MKRLRGDTTARSPTLTPSPPPLPVRFFNAVVVPSFHWSSRPYIEVSLPLSSPLSPSSSDDESGWVLFIILIAAIFALCTLK
jgi:hypothetical protein